MTYKKTAFVSQQASFVSYLMITKKIFLSNKNERQFYSFLGRLRFSKKVYFVLIFVYCLPNQERSFVLEHILIPIFRRFQNPKYLISIITRVYLYIRSDAERLAKYLFSFEKKLLFPNDRKFVNYVRKPDMDHHACAPSLNVLNTKVLT